MSQTMATEVIAERYLVLARLGSGGMGEVFRCRDQNLGRTVAVKVLPAPLAARPGFVDRFRAEAQAAARLSHPNVVQVYDWGSSGGSYYMVMEFVRGASLRDILARGPVEPAQAASLLGQLLSALASAHEAGVVHRDIKPENILVTTAGDVKVTDFGIARIAEWSTTSGEMVGTATYAAPEQIRGQAIDGRTDLYAAGILAYELLTGTPPFGGSVAHVLDQHLNAEVPEPSIEVPEASALDAVVAKATRRELSERYATADEMRADLESSASSLPPAPPLRELASAVTTVVGSGAPGSGSGGAVGQTMVVAAKRRHRKWPWLVTLVLLLVVGAAAVFVRPIPKVTGLSQDAALGKLRSAGLHATVQQEHSSTVGQGLVISSRANIVGLGPFALKGGKVALTVSTGPDVRQVPAVGHSQLAAAESAIAGAGLPVGQVTLQYSMDPSMPSGTVISQDPGAGQVLPGQPVNLVVSKGPQMVGVPQVSGTAVSAATAALKAAGLTATIQNSFSPTAVSGTVISQTPLAATSVVTGTAVTIVVSAGPAPFAMPDVSSQPCSAAQATLQAAGLKVAISSQTNGQCTTNPVLFQDPVSGVSVSIGQTATLYVH